MTVRRGEILETVHLLHILVYKAAPIEYYYSKLGGGTAAVLGLLDWLGLIPIKGVFPSEEGGGGTDM